MEKPKKFVRGGNTAIIQNGNVVTDSDNGCLRVVMLRSLGIEKKPDASAEGIFAIGHVNEEKHEATHQANGTNYIREESVTEPITDDVDFGGHIDFGLPDLNIIEEHKSITSKKVHKKVIEDGHYKPNNLWQGASYALTKEYSHFKLIYSSYLHEVDYNEAKTLSEAQVRERLADVTPNIRVFNCEFDENGEILVDTIASGYNISHILDFRREAARVITTHDFPLARPIGTDTFDPCHFCPLKALCNVTTVANKHEFISKARDILQPGDPR